jgi:CubicO group peptidase (beta-lactamase class C family)
MKPTRAGLLALALLVSGCATSPPRPQSPAPSVAKTASYTYRPPPQLDDGWRTTSAEELGLDRRRLEAMTEAIRRQEYANIHAVLIPRDGRLVYEEYFPGMDRRWRSDQRETVRTIFHRDTLHDTRSVGKSITSALVGIALGAGAIASLDTPLVAFFPEHADLATPEKRRITLRHALSMNAGLDWNELDVPYTDPANHSERMHASTDPAGFLLARPMAGEPGKWWSYNSGLPTLLGLVISRATGQPFGAYAREVLFEPLGITDVEWGGPHAWTAIPELAWRGSQAWARVANPGGSLWIRPRDLLKFGSLYLHGGRWNGRQVIPAEWMEESTRRHITVTDSISDHGEHGYGYLWWHDRFRTDAGELEVHTASGNGGQRIFVIPSLNLAVTVLAGRYNDPEANWLPEQLLLRYIVPAARGSEQTRSSALARARLDELERRGRTEREHSQFVPMRRSGS